MSVRKKRKQSQIIERISGSSPCLPQLCGCGYVRENTTKNPRELSGRLDMLGTGGHVSHLASRKAVYQKNKKSKLGLF